MYKVTLHKRVLKFFKKHNDRKFYKQFSEAMHKIALSPFEVTGEDVVKMQGTVSDFRLRIGKFRFIYTVIENEIILFVHSADSRCGIYK